LRRYATVGDGQDVAWWTVFVEELGRVGYEGPISIEYEISLVALEESIGRAARVLVEADAGPGTSG